MQLAILVAMLMLVGQNGFTQLKPIIEEFGGEEVKSAINKAEELNQIISTVQTLTSQQGEVGEQPLNRQQPTNEQPVQAEQPIATSHPLDPINGIADEKILTALSRYVAVGE